MRQSIVMEDAARYCEDALALHNARKWTKASHEAELLRLQSEAAHKVWVALAYYKSLLDVIDDPDELEKFLAAVAEEARDEQEKSNDPQ